jgi:hypothetical protein
MAHSENVLQCCCAAVLTLSNLTAGLQHGMTAALCLTGYLRLLGSLGPGEKSSLLHGINHLSSSSQENEYKFNSNLYTNLMSTHR